MKRILQIAHYYGPLGGIERVLSQFAHGLKKDYEVTVLVSNTNSLTEEFDDHGVRIIRVGRIAHLRRMSICPTFHKWIRKLNPDLLHVHMTNPLAETAVLLAGLEKPIVATYHMDVTRQRLLNFFYRPVQKKFLARTSVITASSENFARTSPVLSKVMDKVQILPYGVADSELRPTSQSRIILEQLKSNITGKVLLFVGRFIHYKGLPILLEAMKTIDATCVLIGSGYMKENLEKQVKNLRLEKKVIFAGRVSDDELIAWYQRADVFVLPSVNRTEAFGLVQLEAMSQGLPVVCTEIGTGTSFINQHGVTGLVVPPSDPQALAEAVNQILSDDDLRRRFSMAALERVRNVFSEDRMLQDLKVIYNKILL